jgi:hypothetical protein
MSLLSTLLSNGLKPPHPLLVLQSSAAKSALPILRKIVERSGNNSLLFCLLYSPSSLVDEAREKIQVFNYLGNVPGYNDTFSDLRQDILTAVKSGKCLRFLRLDQKLIKPRSSCRPIERRHRLSKYIRLRRRISITDVQVRSRAVSHYSLATKSGIFSSDFVAKLICRK